MFSIRDSKENFKMTATICQVGWGTGCGMMHSWHNKILCFISCSSGYFRLSFFVVVIIIASLILWMTTKALRFKKHNFSTAAVVMALTIIAGVMLVYILEELISPTQLYFFGHWFGSPWEIFILILFISVLLIKRFYRISWRKAILACLVNTSFFIFAIIITGRIILELIEIRYLI